MPLYNNQYDEELIKNYATIYITVPKKLLAKFLLTGEQLPKIIREQYSEEEAYFRYWRLDRWNLSTQDKILLGNFIDKHPEAKITRNHPFNSNGEQDEIIFPKKKSETLQARIYQR